MGGGVFFFFNDTATTEIYTLSLHDALPILQVLRKFMSGMRGERIVIVSIWTVVSLTARFAGPPTATWFIVRNGLRSVDFAALLEYPSSPLATDFVFLACS